MKIVTFLELMHRRWWLVPIMTLIGLGLAYAWSVNAPKRYESTVTLQLNPAAKGGLLPYSPDSRSDPVTTLAASYTEVLHTRSFGELVAQNLSLGATPGALSEAIAARLIPNTNIFRLSVTWDNPDDARSLAQGIAEVFIAENLRRQQAQPGTESRFAELETTARSYQTRLDSLRQQREQQEAAAASGDADAADSLNSLDSRISALETSYANLLVELNRARSTIDTASIIDSASPPRTVGPLSLPMALLIGLITGLGAAVGLAYFLDELDDRIRTPLDIVNLVGSAPAAVVGRVELARRANTDQATRLVAIADPRTAGAEAFRTLRTNVRLSATEHPFRSLLVTSPGPSDGKTFVSSNLAIILAQSGQRVLLIDADLRRPSVHKAFGLPNERGLVDILARLDAADDGVAGRLTSEEGTVPGLVSTPVPNLSLLSAGRPPHDPSALLSTNSLGRFLERLVPFWDMVILDTAPVGPVADTLLIAGQVDTALVVSRCAQTRAAELRSTLEALGQVGHPLLGVVLNDFRPGPLSRFTSGGYYYYYGKHYYGPEAAVTNGHSTVQDPVSPGNLPPSETPDASRHS